ncbi:MAG: ankyrin repeat domain-containing protein [Paludibacteraceae bacterium]|nr:ankyrin repeat domain-containing protein [Paludibacteraceae bacterium]
MEQRFGNVSLGEINEMLISFIGKDMYLDYWTKYNPKESIEAYKRKLNRLAKEEDIDFTVLSLVDERSIAKFVFDKILPHLQQEYKLPKYISDDVKKFVYCLYDKFKANKMPILDLCLNYDEFYKSDYREQAKQKNIYAFALIEQQYKLLTEFYKRFDNEGTIKNNVIAMKKGENPSWFIMKQILKQVKVHKKITSLLIEAYIMSNIWHSFQDKVKPNQFVKVQYNVESDRINKAIDFFFFDYGYKTFEQKGNDILKSIEQSTPASEFYCNWFRGFVSVANAKDKGELKQAKDYYKKAFEARRFAGCQFKRFIKQAFALSCYLDFNADKIRDSADSKNGSTSPLSSDAKKFWNYGYAAGVFDIKDENTHLITFHCEENFFSYFRPCMFLKKSFFYELLLPTLEKEYYKLKQLTSKDINRRVKHCCIDQTKNMPIVVVLFYFYDCCSIGCVSLAKKFIDLVEDWLDKFDNIDYSLLSDKGCSIACDAIQTYKNLLKVKKPDLNLSVLKTIVMKIVEKSDTDTLSKNSLKKKRCALQEAIESCDMDIVKAVVEKIGNIDSLRISADESSPVYFAINMYVCCYRLKNHIQLKPSEKAEESMRWKNLDVPGYTAEEKKSYIKRFDKYYKNTIEAVRLLYAKEITWDDLLKIQNICLYLIEHTRKQDDYYMDTEEGKITSLLFAAEVNNVPICRALIEHGADPHINRQSSFLYRCIYWESWDVLEMYMKEFPKETRKDIYTSDLRFFLDNKMNVCKKNKGIDYVRNIVMLFLKYNSQYYDKRILELFADN